MSADRRPCQCGGDVMLEYFDPIKRPVEWFMRCLACEHLSEPCSTKEEAEQQWQCGAEVAA